MLKRAFFTFFFVFFFVLSSIFSVIVDVDVNVKNTSTIFNYNFNFEKGESYSSFSIEKPKDSFILIAQNKNGENLDYSIAGDYFIFKPKETKNQSFNISFESKKVSENLFKTNSFSTYLNFNVPVKLLFFNLKFDIETGKLLEIFPRKYEITSNEEYRWKLDEIGKDTLFLLNFDKVNSVSLNEESISSSFGSQNYIFLILFLIPIILFVFLIFYVKNHFSKSEKKEINQKKLNSEKEINLDENLNYEEKEEKTKLVDGVDEKVYEEVIEKYLTDNEKEIVEVIKENQGISQYDILNFLPKLTKSNLSKIISKLNSRRILNRIKVGKVNKIYLGDKLEGKSKLEEE